MSNNIFVLPQSALGADERRRLLAENPWSEIRRAGSCFVLVRQNHMEADVIRERFLEAERRAQNSTDRR